MQTIAVGWKSDVAVLLILNLSTCFLLLLLVVTARAELPYPAGRSEKELEGLKTAVLVPEGLTKDGREVDFVAATTPGVIYRDLLIQGMRVNEFSGAAPGHIRAYDLRTGAIRWRFNTIPAPGEIGADTWPANAHHQAETMFKAFGRALRMAVEPDPRMAGITPSTKGAL